MTDMLIFIGILLAFLVMFFGHYAGFAWVIIRWTKKPKEAQSKGKKILVQPKISTKERIVACIPVWQAVEVQRALYGKTGVFAPLTIVSLVFMITNCIVSWFFPFNEIVLLILHILFFVGFIMAWAIYGIITANCARLYDCAWYTIALNALVPHVFCFFIKNRVIHVMHDLRKTKTFEGNKDDTIIKQKPVSR